MVTRGKYRQQRQGDFAGLVPISPAVSPSDSVLFFLLSFDDWNFFEQKMTSSSNETKSRNEASRLGS
jgi:hypothetical protein